MWRCPLRELDPKVPKGPRRGREILLIGVADASLRGLGSPKEGEQKTFWSPSLKRVRYLFRENMLRMSALVMPVTFIEKFS